MMRENERCSEISSAPSFSFTVVAPYPSMQYLGCVSRGTSLRFIPNHYHIHGNEKEHPTTAHRHATVVAEQSAIRNQNGLRHLNTVVERQKMLLDASRLLKLIVHDMLRSHQKQLATTSEQRRQNCLPRFPNDTNGFGSVLVVSTIRELHFVVPKKNAVIARGDENIPSTSNRKD